MSSNLFDLALSAEGVTGKLAEVARSIYQQESSGGKNTKTSNAGAMGGMQIIPSTFDSVADKGWDIKDPFHNARAGIRYLTQLDKQSGGVPELTAAGYYGGPRGMEKARQGVAVSDPRNPNAPTTLQYGQQVAARMGKGKAVVKEVPVEQPMAGGVPVVTEAPQMVQAPVVEQVAQAPGMQEPPPWEQFKQAMPSQPVQVADLTYGAPEVMAPQSRPVAMAQIAPDFSMFRGFKGRA